MNALRVEHACPQCGAPVTLEETDRLVECPFCRVRSVLVPKDVFHYVLPCQSPGHDLLYFPYWRFRGTLFTCQLDGVQHRVVDASRQARESPWFPQTLGVRPQAMTLRFATPQTKGRFLSPLLSQGEVTRALVRASHAGPTRIFHRDFIGETASVLYAPFYVNGKVFDAVRERAASPPLPPETRLDEGACREPAESIRFLPTLCPHCGWDLEGERDSLVLFCRQCARAWEPGEGSLKEIEATLLEMEKEEPSRYLPFWRFRARVTGMGIDSYLGFARAANLPAAAHEGARDRPLHFWIPAFKIRPAVLLQLASTFTVSQRAVDETWESRPAAGDGDAPRCALPDRPIHPANLPRGEAADTIKVILASLLRPRAQWLPLLAGAGVETEEARLFLVPFRERGSEILQPRMHLSINRAALAFGRQL